MSKNFSSHGMSRGIIRRDIIETLRAASFLDSKTTLGNLISSALNGKDLKTISDGKLLEGLKKLIERHIENEEKAKAAQ